jgi:hypothetical protein
MVLRDRIGQVINVGELVILCNPPSPDTKYNWILQDVIDYGVTLDLVLCNYYSKQIQFAAPYEVEKQIL